MWCKLRHNLSGKGNHRTINRFKYSYACMINYGVILLHVFGFLHVDAQSWNNSSAVLAILWHSRKYTIFNSGSHSASFACTPHRYHISSMHGSWFQFASNSGIETASHPYQCFKPLAQNNMHADTYICVKFCYSFQAHD